jgi:hypothetical protein
MSNRFFQYKGKKTNKVYTVPVPFGISQKAVDFYNYKQKYGEYHPKDPSRNIGLQQQQRFFNMMRNFK